jgi:predicted nucleotidyltransferase
LGKNSFTYKQLLEEYLAKILKLKWVRGALLFGSLAKGKQLPFPQSDIDLLLITENKSLPEDLWERAEFVRNLEECLSIIQTHWLTKEEFVEHLKAKSGYILDAIFEGKILYDGDQFLKTTIENARKELKERKIRRVGKCWVWPIKKAGKLFEL